MNIPTQKSRDAIVASMMHGFGPRHFMFHGMERVPGHASKLALCSIA